MLFSVEQAFVGSLGTKYELPKKTPAWKASVDVL